MNLPFAGPSGNSFVSGDGSDAYRVSLAAGHVVTLQMGEDPNSADLDLCLFDMNDVTTPVDCSLGLGSREEVVAPFSSEFFVQVFPFNGGSTYTLTRSRCSSRTSRIACRSRSTR